MRVVDRFRGRLEASLAQLGITLPWWIPACTRSASAVFTVVTVVQHGDQLPSAPVLVAGLIALAPLLFWAATRRALPQWLDAATTVTALAILLAHPIPADFCVVLPIIMAAELAATARPVVAVTASLAAMAVFVAAQAWGRMTGYQVDVGGVIFALCAGAALRWYVRALDAERGKQDIAREQAMLAERQRIAREVHDVVAHSLTITLLHVTGARRALQQDRDVDEAVEALVDAEKAGRAAMADIRRTVGLLAPSPTGTHALPGIDDITALVERTKAAGLDVRYDRSGDLASVGDSVGLGLYRIAQESLANIAKHAPHATARMELTVGGAGTRLTVRNSLAGPVAERPPGSGLAGMTARADQLGARLDVGPAERFLGRRRADSRGGGVTESDIRVLLVDDQELVRSGLRRILRRRDGFVIAAECEDGAQVPAALAGNEVDVVVMDLRMKNVDGIEATRRLRQASAHPPVLALTTFDDDELLAGALRAGAAGYVLKDSSAEDLIRAVRAVAAGAGWLDAAVTARVLTTYRQAAPERSAAATERLTPREFDVLRAVGRGLTNAEIATALGITEVTVKSHLGRVFVKLALRDRAAAIVYAFDHGIVTPN